MSDPTPRRLGRGLGALLGEAGNEAATTGARASVQMLAISALNPHPGQPRRRFDESALEELAASIRQRGIIQPIIVRPHGHGFQIVAGERRWRAAQRAQLHEVPVVVREFSDAETLEVALIENIQREDLNAIEEAEAYHRLIAEFGHTQEALAKAVDKSRSHVTNLLRLLDLPKGVQSRVVDGVLSMGHARALLGADDIEGLADQVVAKGLSVRETEKLAKAAKGRPERKRGAMRRDADIAALENQLADLLGLVVRIKHTVTGGTLSLDYSTLDQLDMVCQRLSGERI